MRMRKKWYLILAAIVILFIAVLFGRIAVMRNREAIKEAIREKEAYASLVAKIGSNHDSVDISPLTYAGRSEYVPFSTDVMWDLLTIDGEEVYLYYWPDIGKELSQAAQKTPGLLDCIIAGDFVFYYRGSKAQIIELLSKLSDDEQAVDPEAVSI